MAAAKNTDFRQLIVIIFGRFQLIVTAQCFYDIQLDFLAYEPDADNLKEWYAGSATSAVQYTAGPLKMSDLDAGDVPASSIAMIGCGTIGDITATKADGVLAGTIMAPYNLPQGSDCAESFNDGPSVVSGNKVVVAGKAGSANRALLESSTLFTVGQI